MRKQKPAQRKGTAPAFNGEIKLQRMTNNQNKSEDQPAGKQLPFCICTGDWDTAQKISKKKILLIFNLCSSHPRPTPNAKFQAGNTYNMLTPNVCRTAPLKASISRMKPPLVDIRMSLPSLLNFRPVHSHVRSYCILNVANGPFKEKKGGIWCITANKNPLLTLGQKGMI